MKYVDNNGIKIAYRIDGNGPPIVLVHGGFGYKEMWDEMGVIDDLKDNFLLISIDLRGHGDSDKPHNPNDYSMKAFVSDIISIMDNLKLNKITYWGYSMGGWIGYGMAKYAPGRIRSLIIGGAQSSDKWTESWKSGWIELFEKGETATFEAIRISLLDSKNKDIEWILNKWIEKIKRTDLKAMSALMENDEILRLDEALINSSFPCILYGGVKDKGSWMDYIETLNNIPYSTIITIPGNHISVALSYKLIRKDLKQFLNDF